MIRFVPQRGQLSLAATAAVLVALFAGGALAYPNFGSLGVVRNLLVDNAFLGIAALGTTLVILSGGIDLSVGSVMAFTSIMLASLVENAGLHPLAAIPIVVCIALIFGFIQGALIQYCDLPPFMVTLAGLFFARAAAFAVAPQSAGITHAFVGDFLVERCSFDLRIGAEELNLPLTVQIWLLATVAVLILLTQFRLGRSIHAIGGDAHAAMLMGIPVASTRIAVYALAGALSGLAGVAFSLYQQSGDPASCRGLELDAIAAVVIGGTLLRGGVGSVIGTTMGVMILGLIQTILAFQGNLSSWWARIAIGMLLLLFVSLQRVLESTIRRLHLRESGEVDVSKEIPSSPR